VNIDDLKRNAGVLPITETGLRSIIEDLEANRDLDPEGFVDAVRFSLRALGALMPPERFDLLTIAEVAGVDPSVTLGDLLEVLNATGDYIGETPVNVVRTFIGLVDDAIRPDIAGRYLGIDEDEAVFFEEFLDLRTHWAGRLLDKVHIILLDGGGTREVASQLNCTRFMAWRLARYGRRNLAEMGISLTPSTDS
jgi:hypothetical protein